MKKTVFMSLLFLVLVSSCTKNKNQDYSVYQDEKNKMVSENTDKQSDYNPSKIVVDEIENAMNDFKQGIKFFSEYKFDSITNYDLNLLSFQINADKALECYYDGNQFCIINDLNMNIEQIYNYCVPYSNYRLFSAAFGLVLNGNFYFGVINMPEGIIKVYESLQSDNQNSPLFYSGNSKYFVMDNTRIIKPRYYDYKTFRTIQDTFGGYIEIYSFLNNELVYRIDKRKLHETILLDIDKIQYEEDGFKIILGNYQDSDEFVDFKVFTDCESFHYEIYDKYTYERND